MSFKPDKARGTPGVLATPNAPLRSHPFRLGEGRKLMTLDFSQFCDVCAPLLQLRPDLCHAISSSVRERRSSLKNIA